MHKNPNKPRKCWYLITVHILFSMFFCQWPPSKLFSSILVYIHVLSTQISVSQVLHVRSCCRLRFLQYGWESKTLVEVYMNITWGCVIDWWSCLCVCWCRELRRNLKSIQTVMYSPYSSTPRAWQEIVHRRRALSDMKTSGYRSMRWLLCCIVLLIQFSGFS